MSAARGGEAALAGLLLVLAVLGPAALAGGGPALAGGLAVAAALALVHARNFDAEVGR